VRVVVDHERCELNALCTLEAPSLFAVVDGPDGPRLEVRLDEVPEEIEAVARAAVAACPTGALMVIEP
jgi:ferredoxin